MAGGPTFGPLPRLGAPARAALDAARARMRAGDREGAMEILRPAFQDSPAIACHPWGLLPLLRAEGRAGLRRRLRRRVAAWYRPGPGLPPGGCAALTPKPRLRRWAAEQGIETPRLIATAPGLEALDWAALPPRGIVIKPEDGNTRKGVVIPWEGRDLMAKGPIPGDLEAYVRARWAEAGVTRQGVLVEELLVEAGRTPGPHIPRDLKGYAVNGRVAAVQVVERNTPEGAPQLMAPFDPQGRLLPRINHSLETDPSLRPPPGLEAAVALIERVSALLPWMMRIDVYATTGGPVLGELTPYPSAGTHYTRFGRRLLLQMWEIYPD